MCAAARLRRRFFCAKMWVGVGAWSEMQSKGLRDISHGEVRWR